MTGFSRTDILLLRYAAGSLDTAETLVIVTWLAFDQGARRRVEAFEELGGQLMQEEPPTTLSAECLEVVLRRIEHPRTPLEQILELFSGF